MKMGAGQKSLQLIDPYFSELRTVQRDVFYREFTKRKREAGVVGNKNDGGNAETGDSGGPGNGTSTTSTNNVNHNGITNNNPGTTGVTSNSNIGPGATVTNNNNITSKSNNVMS